MLGASQAALLGAAASAAVTYDTLVGIFNPDLVSYWKFENDGVDEKGIQNASFIGSPELNVETIVDLDTIADGAAADGKCIAWPGTPEVHAQANHNAAHKTPEGTIAVTFQHDSLGQKSTLVAADANAAAGGLSLEVQSDGSPRSFLRRHSNGAAVIIVGQAGDVQLNQAYTMVFKWGQGGLSMALWNEDGSLVRRVTNTLTDGVTGTSPISFGLWHDGVQSPHDGPYGRVIWLKRRISHGEEAILARARTIDRPTGEYITTPEAHGWSAVNTNAQNTAAFNAAIDDARTNAASSVTGRGVVELVQGKTYTVRSTSGSGPSNNIPALTTNLSNVEIRTAGKPTRASGSQAVIRFESWSGKTGILFQTLIRLQDVSNFKLGWVTLDGNKNSIDNVLTDINYTQGQNGGLNNITCYGTLTDVTLKEVDSRMALTDGMLQRVDAVSNVLVEDCNFTRNRRQGVSISKCGMSTGGFDQWIYRRCLFNQTGDFPGDVLGNQPAAGVDVEPDQTSQAVYGLTFGDCDFDENYGSTTNNGSVRSQGTPFGLKWDCRAPADEIKLINCRYTNQATQNGVTGRAIAIICRGDPRFDNWLIEDNVCSGNGSNLWRFSGSTGGDGGTLTNITMINTNTDLIDFEAGLNDTGHSVTIWKGNFNPTVTTNGKTTITVNNAFPS